MDIAMGIKLTLGAIVGVLAYLLGGWDLGIQYLIIAVTLDYIFGILTAVYEKKYSYTTAWKGILKKVGFFGIIAVAVLIERTIGHGEILHPYIIYYFIGNECFSMLKNFKILGVPIPDIFEKEVEELYNKYTPFNKGGSA